MKIKPKFNWGDKIYYFGGDIYYPHNGYIEEINCRSKLYTEVIYTIRDYNEKELKYIKESECFSSKEKLANYIRRIVDNYFRI